MMSNISLMLASVIFAILCVYFFVVGIPTAPLIVLLILFLRLSNTKKP